MENEKKINKIWLKKKIAVIIFRGLYGCIWLLVSDMDMNCEHASFRNYFVESCALCKYFYAKLWSIRLPLVFSYVRIMPSPQTQLAFVTGPLLSLTSLTDRMEQAIPENRLTSGKLWLFTYLTAQFISKLCFGRLIHKQPLSSKSSSWKKYSRHRSTP